MPMRRHSSVAVIKVPSSINSRPRLPKARSRRNSVACIWVRLFAKHSGCVVSQCKYSVMHAKSDRTSPLVASLNAFATALLSASVRPGGRPARNAPTAAEKMQ